MEKKSGKGKAFVPSFPVQLVSFIGCALASGAVLFVSGWFDFEPCGRPAMLIFWITLTIIGVVGGSFASTGIITSKKGSPRARIAT